MSTETTEKQWTRVKALEGGVKFIKNKELKVGDVYEGMLEKVTPAADTKFKKIEYYLKQDDQQVVCFNEGGNLKSQMDEVTIGDLIRIEYLGKKALPKGHPFAGTESHQFLVTAPPGDISQSEDSQD